MTESKFYKEIYLPREDTFLMEKALKKQLLKNKSVLEIGCGSGYLSIYCAKQNAIMTSIDINENAIYYAKKKAEKNNVKIKFIESNLFENVKNKYDIIFFNPPYLISDEIKELALDGGKEGREIIDKFLDCFSNYLKEKGFALLLHTNYNNLNKTEKKLKKIKFKYEIIEKQHLFFEELYILKIYKI